MKTKTAQILRVMHILAWVAFIGFLIQTGSIIISYIVSCINPVAAQDFPLHKGADLHALRQSNFLQYTYYVSFGAAAYALKAYVWFLVIKTISIMNITNPFKIEVVHKLERISHVLLGIWIIGMLSNAHVGLLLKMTGQLYVNEVSGESIFVAGLVFIISQIFKRGVEIQSENELTV